jgi:hypothetical protein
MSVAAHKSARHPTAPPVSSNTVYRLDRHKKRNMKLHRELFDLVTAHPQCRYVGSNGGVEAIAEGLGFQSHDLAIANIKIGRRIIALICVPHRLWDTPYPTSKVLDLRAKARSAGYTAIVVPQAVILREPRFGNAKLLNRTRTLTVDTTSRMRVLAHLIENGPTCLSELAELVQHNDPFGAVLYLVTTGVITIDMGKCITPYTMADIATPAAAQN